MRYMVRNTNEDLSRVAQRLFGNATDPSGVDLYKEDKLYTLEMDIPGLDKESLDITLEKSLLTIKGKKNSADSDKRHYYQKGRHFGEFVKRFSVPSNTSSESIKASYKDGVLKIEFAENVSESKINVLFN
ncbi:MAG: Hsp20/alpha crystallin family protein [Candidatus Delongbacteria bacterium]|nr:Hsp20/alpha crystallin family protein [Candidatus Delongbacteria bacterium]MBN2834613.1 Hsp20/alpha crystallin family protein [Candidatus Delongbacteria bacterium]